jgi:hypothetical protein
MFHEKWLPEKAWIETPEQIPSIPSKTDDPAYPSLHGRVAHEPLAVERAEQRTHRWIRDGMNRHVFAPSEHLD